MNAKQPIILVTCMVMALVWSFGCDDEPAEDVSEISTAASASVSASIKPAPSPIPDELLLAELRRLPVVDGSTPGDPVYPAGSAFSGTAGRDFTAIANVDTVLEFYRDALESTGWTPEGEPREETFAPESPLGTKRVIQWTFLKDDMRLLLGIDTSPKAGSPGQIDYGLGIQPIWYPTASPQR